jgi:hypothetical protein
MQQRIAQPAHTIVFDLPNLLPFFRQNLHPAARGYGRVEVTPAPEPATDPSLQRTSSQDVIVKLSAPAELRRARSGATSESSELAAALKARYGSNGGFVEPAAEPESRSCGRDRFRNAVRIYDEAKSSLDEEAMLSSNPKRVHSSYQTSSYSSWVIDDGSSLPPEASLQEQLEFWRHQQELLQQQLALLPPSSRPGSRANSRGPSRSISRAGSGNLLKQMQQVDIPAAAAGQLEAWQESTARQHRQGASCVSLRPPQHSKSAAAAAARAAEAAARRGAEAAARSAMEASAAAEAAVAPAGLDSTDGQRQFSSLKSYGSLDSTRLTIGRSRSLKQRQLQAQPAFKYDPDYELELMTHKVLQLRNAPQQEAAAAHPTALVAEAAAAALQQPANKGPRWSLNPFNRTAAAAAADTGSPSSSSSSPFSAYAATAWGATAQVEQMAAAIISRSRAGSSAGGAPCSSSTAALQGSTTCSTTAGTCTAAGFGLTSRLNTMDEVQAMAAAVLSRKKGSTTATAAAPPAAAAGTGSWLDALSSAQTGNSPCHPAAAAAAARHRASRAHASEAGLSRSNSIPAMPSFLDPMEELQAMAASVLRNKGITGSSSRCAAADTSRQQQQQQEIGVSAGSSTGHRRVSGTGRCSGAGGPGGLALAVNPASELQEMAANVMKQRPGEQQQQQQPAAAVKKDASKGPAGSTAAHYTYMDPLAELQAMTASVLKGKAVVAATAAAAAPNVGKGPLHLSPWQQQQTSTFVKAAKQGVGLSRSASNASSVHQFMDPSAELQAMAANVLRNKPAAAAAGTGKSAGAGKMHHEQQQQAAAAATAAAGGAAQFCLDPLAELQAMAANVLKNKPHAAAAAGAARGSYAAAAAAKTKAGAGSSSSSAVSSSTKQGSIAAAQALLMDPLSQLEAMTANVLKNKQPAAAAAAAAAGSHVPAAVATTASNTAATAAPAAASSLQRTASGMPIWIDPIKELETMTANALKGKPPQQQQQQQPAAAQGSRHKAAAAAAKPAAAAAASSIPLARTPSGMPVWMDPMKELEAMTANVLRNKPQQVATSTVAAAAAAAAAAAYNKFPSRSAAAPKPAPAAAAATTAAGCSSLARTASSAPAWMDPVKELEAMTANVLNGKSPAAAAAAGGRAGSSVQQLQAALCNAAAGAAAGGPGSSSSSTSSRKPSSKGTAAAAASSGLPVFADPLTGLQAMTASVLSAKAAAAARDAPKRACKGGAVAAAVAAASSAAAAAAAAPAKAPAAKAAAASGSSSSSSSVQQFLGDPLAGLQAMTANVLQKSRPAAAAAVPRSDAKKAPAAVAAASKGPDSSSSSSLAASQPFLDPVAGLQAMTANVLNNKPLGGAAAAAAAAEKAAAAPAEKRSAADAVAGSTVTKGSAAVSAAETASSISSAAMSMCLDPLSQLTAMTAAVLKDKAAAAPSSSSSSAAGSAAASLACSVAGSTSGPAAAAAAEAPAAAAAASSGGGSTSILSSSLTPADALEAMAARVLTEKQQRDAERAAAAEAGAWLPGSTVSIANIRSSLMKATKPQSPKKQAPRPNAAARQALTARLPGSDGLGDGVQAAGGSNQGSDSGVQAGGRMRLEVHSKGCEVAEMAARVLSARGKSAAAPAAAVAAAPAVTVTEAEKPSKDEAAAAADAAKAPAVSAGTLDSTWGGSCSETAAAAAAAAGRSSFSGWAIATAPHTPCSPSTPSSCFSALAASPNSCSVVSHTGSVGSSSSCVADSVGTTGSRSPAASLPSPSFTSNRTPSGGSDLSEGSGFTSSSSSRVQQQQQSGGLGLERPHSPERMLALTTRETADEAAKLTELLQATAEKAAIAALEAAAATAASAEASAAQQTRIVEQHKLAELDHQLRQEAAFQQHLLTEEQAVEGQQQQQRLQTPLCGSSSSQRQQQQEQLVSPRPSVQLPPASPRACQNPADPAVVNSVSNSVASANMTEQAKRRMQQEEEQKQAVLDKLKRKEEQVQKFESQKQQQLQLQRPAAGWLSPRCNNAVAQAVGSTGKAAAGSTGSTRTGSGCGSTSSTSSSAAGSTSSDTVDSRPRELTKLNTSAGSKTSSRSTGRAEHQPTLTKLGLLAGQLVSPAGSPRASLQQQQQNGLAAAAAAAAAASGLAMNLQRKGSSTESTGPEKSLRQQHQERQLALQQQQQQGEPQSPSGVCTPKQRRSIAVCANVTCQDVMLPTQQASSSSSSSSSRSMLSGQHSPKPPVSREPSATDDGQQSPKAAALQKKALAAATAAAAAAAGPGRMAVVSTADDDQQEQQQQQQEQQQQQQRCPGGEFKHASLLEVMKTAPRNPGSSPARRQLILPAAAAAAATVAATGSSSSSSSLRPVSPVTNQGRRSQLRMLQTHGHKPQPPPTQQQQQQQQQVTAQQPPGSAGMQYARLSPLRGRSTTPDVAVRREGSFSSSSNMSAAAVQQLQQLQQVPGPVLAEAAAGVPRGSNGAATAVRPQTPPPGSAVRSLVRTSIGGSSTASSSDASWRWKLAMRRSGGGVVAAAGSGSMQHAVAGSAPAVSAAAAADGSSSKDPSSSSSSSLWGKITKNVSKEKLMPLLTGSSKRVSDTGGVSKRQQQQSAAAAAATAAVEQLAQEQVQVLARSKARDWQGIAGMNLAQIQQLSVEDLMTVMQRLPYPAGGSSKPARDFARFELAMMWVEGDRQKRQHSRRMEDSLEMVDFAGFDKQQLWEARRFPAVDSSVFLRQRLLMAYQERMMQPRREEEAEGLAV